MTKALDSLPKPGADVAPADRLPRESQEKALVQFATSMPPYNAGEVAGFDLAHAARLVIAGVAVPGRWNTAENAFESAGNEHLDGQGIVRREIFDAAGLSEADYEAHVVRRRRELGIPEPEPQAKPWPPEAPPVAQPELPPLPEAEKAPEAPPEHRMETGRTRRRW